MFALSIDCAAVVKIPPPPRGLPRRLRNWYVLVAAACTALATVTAPMCPVRDGSGLPAWRVERVHDGDTVTCADERGASHKIRLVGIDAPESDQAYGGAARTALAAKVAGRAVRVDGRGHDQHGRLLGTLFLDGRDINREMVAEGWAWVFGGFAPDDELVAVEAEARRLRRGLWADPRPQAPAEWRHAHPSRH